MKIGILGGTFDPIHLGHIRIAQAAWAEYALDEVWFMPANVPYFKAGKEVTDADVRLRMTEDTVRFINPAFCCSDFEIHGPAKSEKTYTADTLSLLHSLRPEDELYFIMGMDSLMQIDSWHEPEKIFSSAVILCAMRDIGNEKGLIEERIDVLSEKYADVAPDIRCLEVPEFHVSSTEVRELIRSGRSTEGLLHERTLAFIRQQGLYGVV